MPLFALRTARECGQVWPPLSDWGAPNGYSPTVESRLAAHHVSRIRRLSPIGRFGEAKFENFCGFAGRPTSPADPDTLLLRSAPFRSGKPFGRYLAHVMKAAIRVRRPTDWLTLNIKWASKGARLESGKSFRPKTLCCNRAC